MRLKNLITKSIFFCTLFLFSVISFAQSESVDSTSTSDTISPNNKTTKLLFEEIKTNIDSNQDNNIFTFIMIGIVVIIVGIAMYISFSGKDDE